MLSYLPKGKQKKFRGGKQKKFRGGGDRRGTCVGAFWILRCQYVNLWLGLALMLVVAVSAVCILRMALVRQQFPTLNVHDLIKSGLAVAVVIRTSLHIIAPVACYIEGIGQQSVTSQDSSKPPTAAAAVKAVCAIIACAFSQFTCRGLRF